MPVHVVSLTMVCNFDEPSVPVDTRKKYTLQIETLPVEVPLIPTKPKVVKIIA